MSDEKLEKVELVLDEPLVENAAVELTLDTTPAPAAAMQEQKPVELSERANLTPAEMQQVEDFAKKINLKDSNIVVQYGSGAQKKMSDFSESALAGVRTKDMDGVDEMLVGLMANLRNFDSEDEKGGIFGFFKKTGNKIEAMKARYATVEQNINHVVGELEKHQVTLMKDIAVLDKMYDQNVVYFKELTMYILAGKKKLEEVRTTELPALREKAQKSNLPEDAQAANDLDSLCNRFEKKLHDLDLTRNMSIQMAPQIRMMQNNDIEMSEKIHSSIVNTIPLWKNQMVLALTTAHTQKAVKAQREVTDMTNELLRKNSEALKMATIETAKESERSIIDIETLQQTNQNLIETLDEVVRIQTEGRQKRAAAEVELGRIEGELKQKLLQIRE